MSPRVLSRDTQSHKYGVRSWRATRSQHRVIMGTVTLDGSPSRTPRGLRPRATPSPDHNCSQPHTIKWPSLDPESSLAQGRTPSGPAHVSPAPGTLPGPRRRRWPADSRHVRTPPGRTPPRTRRRANEPTALLGGREPVVGRGRAVTQH